MIQFIVMLLVSFTLLACSSNSSGGGGGGDGAKGPVTTFEKKTGGEWLSKCTRLQDGAFQEKLSLQPAGVGSSTTNYYQTADCSGAIAKAEGPTAFSYKVDKPDARDGEQVKLTLTFTGKEPVELTLVTQGNRMTISTPQITVEYDRISAPPQQPKDQQQDQQQDQQGQPVNGDEFEKLALGNWVTTECRQNPNGGTFLFVLSIMTGGRAAGVYNLYQDQNCGGDPQQAEKSDITYQVVRFKNGVGQLMVNNQTIDIVILGKNMTITDANGATDYVKVN